MVYILRTMASIILLSDARSPWNGRELTCSPCTPMQVTAATIHSKQPAYHQAWRLTPMFSRQSISPCLVGLPS